MKTNWIDFKALRARLDFAAVLEHYGVEVKRKGSQHHGPAHIWSTKDIVRLLHFGQV